jgi:hypothetical protein
MEGQCIDSRDPPLSLDTGPGLGRSKTELLVGELWRVVTKTGTFSTRPPQKRWVIDREGLRESDVLHLTSTHQVLNPRRVCSQALFEPCYLHWARWAYILFLTMAARDIQSRSA